MLVILYPVAVMKLSKLELHFVNFNSYKFHEKFNWGTFKPHISHTFGSGLVQRIQR